MADSSQINVPLFFFLFKMGNYIVQWFPAYAPRIPRDPRPIPMGIRGYTSLLATLNFILF